MSERLWADGAGLTSCPQGRTDYREYLTALMSVVISHVGGRGRGWAEGRVARGLVEDTSLVDSYLCNLAEKTYSASRQRTVRETQDLARFILCGGEVDRGYLDLTALRTWNGATGSFYLP